MQYLQFSAARADTGAVLPRAKVTVYLTGTVTPAALFNLAGGSIANPVSADDNGAVGFAAANGAYDLSISSEDGSYTVPPIHKVQLYDLTELDAKVITATTAAGASGDSATLAGHFANDSANAAVPGQADPTARGAKYWSLLASSVLSDPGMVAVVADLTGPNNIGSLAAISDEIVLCAANMAAILDAPNQAAAAAASAGAIGTASGTKSVTYGFTSALLPAGSTWPNNSVIWTGITVARDCYLRTLKAQIGAIGAVDLIVGTAGLSGTTTVVTKIGSNHSLTAPTGANQIMPWAFGPTDIFCPAGSSLFFSLPATTGATMIHDTTLTGRTEYGATGGPFSAGTRTLTRTNNSSPRVRATVDEVALQVPRSGLIDEALVATLEPSAGASRLATAANVVVSCGSSMLETGNSGLGPAITMTLGTIAADGVLNDIEFDASAAGSAPTIELLVLRGTAPDFDILRSATLNVIQGRNRFTKAQLETAFGSSVPLLNGDTMAFRSPTNGPTILQLVPKGNSNTSFYYGVNSVMATGAGRLTLVPNFVLKARFTVLTPVLQVGKVNLSAALRGLERLAQPTAPLTFDMMGYAGQSNFLKSSGYINPETVAAGIAYIWDGAQFNPYLGDTAAFTATIAGTVLTVTAMASGKLAPGEFILGTGVAANTRLHPQNTGTGVGGVGTYDLVSSHATLGSTAMTQEMGASMVPAMVNSYFQASGNGVMIVQGAVGGSGLDVASTAGNWSPSGGLRPAFTAMVAAAKAWAVTNNYAFEYVATLIAQGETDAAAIDSGTNNLTAPIGAMTGAKWVTAFGVWRADIVANVHGGNANVPIILSRLGSPGTGETAGFTALRAAQRTVVRTYSNVFIGYKGAINWRAQGETDGGYHGTPISYKWMGTDLGRAAAVLCVGMSG